MKFELIALSRRYAAELRKNLQDGCETGLHPAVRLGRRAVALGMETLELARMHEQALASLKVAAGSPQFRTAEVFFTEAMAPIVDTHPAARQNKSKMDRLNTLLKRRTAELAARNHRLKQGVDQRRNVELSLKHRRGQY